jgi:hypothetical protein
MNEISADFPGVMRRVVEELVGGLALYVQGAAGNINPALIGPHWEWPHRSGTALGAEAARIALTAQPVEALPLRVARETVALPAILPASAEAARASIAALEQEQVEAQARGANEGSLLWIETRLERARAGLAALETGRSLPPVSCDIGALRIGDLALATNPSELFCEIGMAIKRDAPFPYTGVAGYTDGPAVGYVPTRAAYPEGGYEVERACRVNPEGGELVEATSRRLLRSLSH